MEERHEPFGRPTLYKPEYCERLIGHMSNGLSFESFAAVIDVNRDTLYEWVKTHTDFSDAKKRATDKCLLWWEVEGINALNRKFYQPAIWIFNVRNRFGWTDKAESKSELTPILFAYDPSRKLNPDV